jgi:hypothetical protein
MDSEDDEEDLEMGTESWLTSNWSEASKQWKEEAEFCEEFVIFVRARCTMTSVWICWARNIRSFDVLTMLGEDPSEVECALLTVGRQNISDGLLRLASGVLDGMT